MPVRWGILGVGDIVRKRVARAIQQHAGSVLLAACRRDLAKLREFCQGFGVERGYASDRELLADRAIDAVYIATPVSEHLPQTLSAAAAGKHVLVEKPMARSSAECRLMIDACQKAGVRLGVAYYRRFYPIVRRMKELLAAGTIGQPLSVSAVTSTPFAKKAGEEGYWRVLADQGGGALMDIGSHRINLFLDLFGDATRVHALCDTLAGHYPAEDCANLVLRFVGGVHGNLQCYFGTQVALDSFSILGTAGKLLADPLNGSSLEVIQGTERRLESHPPAANLHAPLVADFADAIAQGRESLVTGTEGLRTNEVMERAYRAAAES